MANTGDPTPHANLPAARNGTPSNGTAVNGSTGRLAGIDGGGGGVPAAPAAQGAAADGFLHVLGRRWPLVVFGLVLGVLAGVAYVLVSRPVYTSVAVLRVDPLDPEAIGGNNGGGNAAAEAAGKAEFLETECGVIRSNAVLAVAAADPRVRDSRTLAGVARPIEALKRALVAEPEKKGGFVDVAFATPHRDEADGIVTAVVKAYESYESDYWAHRAKGFLDVLKNGQADQQRELLLKQQQMREMARVNGFSPDGDPAHSPAHEAVVAMREAKQRAGLEVIRASNAYEEAQKAILGDGAKLQAVEDALARSPYSANPAEQLQTIQSSLLIEQSKLADAGRVYGQSHPIIRSMQSRIDQLTVGSVVAAKQWQQATRSQADAIDRSLAEAGRAEAELAKNQDDYTRLAAEVSRLRKVGDEVDGRMKQVDLTKGAGAMNISVLNEATIDPRQEKPNKPKILGLATVLGLLAGVGLAVVRDWTDDRLRSPTALRAAAGTGVLGAVPTITSAHTTADRGQIVHHDPYGDASESYRTLRTALLYGLPARTKTVLFTSPSAGDGKSTTVSNLGIALAQVSKRVLIVDADLRSPVQHRIFNLRDYAGVATVLDGADTLEAAIQHTAVEGLDVLPCGPTPSNPAELLNDPAFAEHLNDLADRYDLVLLDSPPVATVADARILGALVDASVLVVRMETSTQRQIAAARDGLRSVGARLVGVVANAVGRRGGADFDKSVRYPSRGPIAAATTTLATTVSAADGVDETLDELADHARQR